MSIKKTRKIRIKYKNNFIFLVIGFVVLLVCFIVFTSNQIPKTIYPLPQYDKIAWQPEKASSVYALLSPDTPDEVIQYTEGVEMIGEDTNNNPQELYTFYDQKLTNDGFEKINVVGSPAESTTWVASYKKGFYYFEVQYYVTPENKDTKTSMVFSGILPN